MTASTVFLPFALTASETALTEEFRVSTAVFTAFVAVVLSLTAFATLSPLALTAFVLLSTALVTALIVLCNASTDDLTALTALVVLLTAFVVALTALATEVIEPLIELILLVIELTALLIALIMFESSKFVVLQLFVPLQLPLPSPLLGSFGLGFVGSGSGEGFIQIC